MEQSVTSLAFKGTIAEAIAEAKREKKVFVVYTSGDYPDSKLLETSTWIDPSVSAILAKYCVFLHILEGSSEASYFSAIYPQNKFPCITAIGYNGARFWQNEGFVAADVLVSALEKAWLSLHLQETTAAFLSAALASGASGSPFSEQGTQGTLPTTTVHNLSLDAQRPMNSEARVERNTHEDSCKEETDSKLGDGTSLTASHVNGLNDSQIGQHSSFIETENISLLPEKSPNDTEIESPVLEGKDSKFDGDNFLTSHVNVLDSSQRGERSSIIETENISLSPEEKTHNEVEVESPVPVDLPVNFYEVSQNMVEEVSSLESQEISGLKKVARSDSPATKSNLVSLKIRLPDGASLQASFSVMDTLRVVHDYINDNQTSSLGPYNLESPYPRIVFNDQDLNRTLSALGLHNRYTLIVVPQNQAYSSYRGGSSMHFSDDLASSSERNEGYWASVKRILSYANPLSYLSRGAASSSAATESHSSMSQYSPSSSLQNNTRGSSSSAPVHLPDQSPTADGRNSSSGSRQQMRGFGGNVHTLKHDEDDNSDRNVFWNGNSTQFGGNGDGK